MRKKNDFGISDDSVCLNLNAVFDSPFPENSNSTLFDSTQVFRRLTIANHQKNSVFEAKRNPKLLTRLKSYGNETASRAR